MITSAVGYGNTATKVLFTSSTNALLYKYNVKELWMVDGDVVDLLLLRLPIGSTGLSFSPVPVCSTFAALFISTFYKRQNNNEKKKREKTPK